MKNSPEKVLAQIEELKGSLVTDPSGNSQSRTSTKPAVVKPNDAWLLRQQFQDMCHDLIVADYGAGAELAVTKRVEQDLWNFAFRQQISLLETQLEQQQQQSALGSVLDIRLAATRTSLQYFLELASGFYLQLMQEVSVIASLDVHPLYRNRDHFGALSPASLSSSLSSNGSSMPKSIATYLVQHCLVHLGDLARYMAKLAPVNDASITSETTVDHLEIAQHYYVSAAMLVPFSGQPFNQLAIVEAQQGNRLGAAYLYARALSARSPFPAAEQNLTRLLERILASCPLVRDNQATMTPPKSLSETVSVCVQLLATAWLKPSTTTEFVGNTLLLHLGNAAQCFLSDRVGATFSWFQLVQLAFLNTFIATRRCSSPQGHIAFRFSVLLLSHLVRELLPLVKKDGEILGRSPLLPATRLVISFMATNAEMFGSCSREGVGDIKSPHLWHALARLADASSVAAKSSSLAYSSPLPEDVELRGCTLFSSDNPKPDIENSDSDNESSSLGETTSYASSSSSSIAYLACARFSEACTKLASTFPQFLSVISSESGPRFFSPLPLPLNQTNLMAAVQINTGTTLNGQMAFDVQQKLGPKRGETPPSVRPAFSHSSSASSIGANSVSSSSEKPRNVVFQSIVHTMRARGQQQTSTSSPNLGHGVPAVPGNNNNSNSPYGGGNAVPSPRLGQRFNHQQRDSSNSGRNTPRNLIDDSDQLNRQGSIHRNLPPRLARLAEAEAKSSSSSNLANSLVNSVNSYENGNGGYNPSSSRNSGPVMIGSGTKQNPVNAFQNSSRFQDIQMDHFSASDAAVRQKAGHSSAKSSSFGLPDKLSELDTHKSINENTGDDGWQVLSMLKSHLSESSQSKPAFANYEKDSSLMGQSKSRSGDALKQSPALSLFGLPTTVDSEGNWPFSLTGDSSKNQAEMRQPIQQQPAKAFSATMNNSGWSPLLSSVSAFSQNSASKPTPNDLSTLAQSIANVSSSYNREQQQQNQHPGYFLGSRTTTSNAGNVNERSNVNFEGWSQLQSNGISPSKLWSAFGLEIPSNPIGESAAGIPPS